VLSAGKLLSIRSTPTRHSVVRSVSLTWFLPCSRLRLSRHPIPASHVFSALALIVLITPHCLTSRLLFAFAGRAYFKHASRLYFCPHLTSFVVPFNSCIYRGRADTLTHTTWPHCAPPFIFFGCLLFFVVVHAFAFLSTFPSDLPQYSYFVSVS
jgi:hypothetical protein